MSSPVLHRSAVILLIVVTAACTPVTAQHPPPGVRPQPTATSQRHPERPTLAARPAAPPALHFLRTFHVDAAHGDDGNSGRSPAAAWRTLGRVNRASFRPGDGVLLRRGGSWRGPLELRARGTRKAKITLAAYGDGARPVISGGGVEVGGSYWVVRGVRTTGARWAGVELSGTHNEVRDVHTDHNVVGVSIPDRGSDNLVAGNAIVDNNRMSVNTPKAHNPYDDSGAFGVLLNGDRNIVTHNKISGSFAKSYDYGTDGAAVEIYNGDRNVISHNVTSDNDTFTELGREGRRTADGNVFAYNVVTTTKDRGAFLVTRGAGDSLGPVRGTVVANNTVSLPGRGGGWVCYAGCAPGILKLRNNVISVGGVVGQEDGAGADDDTGVYQGRIRFKLGSRSVVADPRFVSRTNLRLRTGSPAIGRAVPLGGVLDLALGRRPSPAARASRRLDSGAYDWTG
ncbi:hypothetical protein ACRYCC_11845 [Actinomadura scrupuli]|uniref:hypothetical protein n=1 Tax=Actinomadura scrupuli TaxID=559629 RepID=UPI003D99EA18